VVLQERQSLPELARTLGVVNGHAEQTDEPRQRVLVHRVDVCQVGDAEEQYGRMRCYRLVAQTSLVDLALRIFGHGLHKQRLGYFTLAR